MNTNEKILNSLLRVKNWIWSTDMLHVIDKMIRGTSKMEWLVDSYASKGTLRCVLELYCTLENVYGKTVVKRVYYPNGNKVAWNKIRDDRYTKSFWNDELWHDWKRRDRMNSMLWTVYIWRLEKPWYSASFWNKRKFDLTFMEWNCLIGYVRDELCFGLSFVSLETEADSVCVCISADTSLWRTLR